MLAEFLDDYYAECDEHLTAARAALLALEEAAQEGTADPTVLDDLLRRFHTIKGLSGMVGLSAAEEAAHRLEDLLRALRRQEIPLTPEVADRLIEGTKAIEQIIAAHREGRPIPDASPVLERLTSPVEQPVPPAGPAPAPPPPDAHLPGPDEPLHLDPAQQAELEAAVNQGMRALRFRFVPSPSLLEKGITVDRARQALKSVGRILQATPRAAEGGAVLFDFLVVTGASDAELEDLRAYGLSWTPYTPQPSAPPAEPERAAAEGSPSVAPSGVVRVDLPRLEALMQAVSDLVISRARLEESLHAVRGRVDPAHWRTLQEIDRVIERQLRHLREGVMRLRMTSIGETFERMRFVVRDLAREQGKRVRLVLEGKETEIDKFVVEQMMDPLLHLVRNAVSHGLERPEEREAQGKPPEGLLILRAFTAGDTVVIEVEDDGRGIDPEAGAARARTLGVLPEGATLEGQKDLLDVLCAPGFSTRQQADRASGRGVGMEVVRQTVESLGGDLHLQTQVGRGTKFTILLPLTLAIIDGLVAAVGDQRFVVPLAAVREVLDGSEVVLSQVGRDEMFAYRGSVLPLVRLSRRFDLASGEDGPGAVLVVERRGQAVGVAVDRVLAQREVVVRSLTDPLVRVPGVAGATELGDGRPVLILDVGDLVEWGVGPHRAREGGANG